MDWLLEERIARQMQRAQDAGLTPSAEQASRYEAAQAAADAEAEAVGLPRNARLAGDTVEIRVDGVLTKRPSFFAMLFGGGGTTYTSIINALAMAQADPRVNRVILEIDSPGGNVDGLFDTLAAIESFKGEKEISVRASNALSAAFGIAAMAGNIEAQSVGAMFGSVGVAISLFQTDSVVDITNSESPNKRPDVSTEEGRGVVVKQLDAIFDLFVDSIARGRGTTPKDVIKNFGRGSTLLAGEALGMGMIDTVRGTPPRLTAIEGDAKAPSSAALVAPGIVAELHAGPVTIETDGSPLKIIGSAEPIETAAVGGVKPQERKSMDEELDLQTLRSRHPELYAAAVSEGESKERDRVTAHVTLGRQAEDLSLACQGIESGEELTQTWTARYMAAGMNRNDRKVRQEETDGAGSTLENVPPVDESKTEDLGDKVVALMEADRKTA